MASKMVDLVASKRYYEKQKKKGLGVSCLKGHCIVKGNDCRYFFMDENSLWDTVINSLFSSTIQMVLHYSKSL